ncbi:MAG TPA: hypothetical protein VHE77_14960 [Dongiaceae bacterium]|jgi:hypothetical protein|nr:hypothetical protein [Dongiaceae bacterium]
MSEITDLKDWIWTPPTGRGAAAFVLCFSLDEFSRNREGLDFLKAFSDRAEQFAKGRGCDFIRISISNAVLTISDQEMIVAGVVSEIKLILLRMIGRMLPDYFGAVDVNRLAQLFDLRRDRDRALQVIDRMEKSAADVNSLSSMMDLLMMEHITKVEHSHRQLGDARFADLFVRSQQIALNDPSRGIQPVMTEFFISMSAIRQHLLVGVDMRHNKNVFNQLTVTLDRILLKCIDRVRRPEQRCSLNINIESVFANEFEAFEKRSLNSLRPFNFEFRASDVMANFTEFIAARDLIQSRGGTIALDGLSPQMIGIIDVSQLQANMAKVFWQAGIGPELMRRQAQFERLRNAGVVLALARVDDPEGFATGRDMRFGLLQGFEIDRQLATPAPVPIHEPFNPFPT